MDDSEFPRGWVSLESSSLAKALYDDNTQILRVEFTSGKTLDYSGISPKQYRDLIHHSSPGRYFQKNISGVNNGQPTHS